MLPVGTASLCSMVIKGVDSGSYNSCVSCDSACQDGGMGVDKVPQAQSLCDKGVDNEYSEDCKLTTPVKGSNAINATP